MKARDILGLAHALVLLATGSVASAQYGEPSDPPADPPNYIDFALERSNAAVNAYCVPYAKGNVHVESRGPVEVMDVWLEGLPANTEFDLFVIQVPEAPFGMSWYQGDMETDEYGKAHEQFIGRFNIETFIIAPGVAPAPQIHGDQFPDAIENPTTAPIHTFHLGLWFNSPTDAGYAGCPDFTTAFNGEHNAGVQVLNTKQFPNNAGPLSQLSN